MSLFKVENISVKKGNQLIFENISFEIEKNKCFVIAGDNGTGKSTLLRLFNRLESPSSGKIKYLDKNIEKLPINVLRKDITMVMQGPVLPDGLVEDFLNHINNYFKLDFDYLNLIEKIGLEKEILKKSVSSLSGGETQLIALISVLMKSPKVLLLDEITAALSPQMTEKVRILIKKFVQQNGTVIMVSHRKDEIEYLGNCGIILKKNGFNYYSEINSLIEDLKEQ